MKNIVKDNNMEFRIGNHRFKGKAGTVKNKTTFKIGKKAVYIKYYGNANKKIIDD